VRLFQAVLPQRRGVYIAVGRLQPGGILPSRLLATYLFPPPFNILDFLGGAGPAAVWKQEFRAFVAADFPLQGAKQADRLSVREPGYDREVQPRLNEIAGASDFSQKQDPCPVQIAQWLACYDCMLKATGESAELLPCRQPQHLEGKRRRCRGQRPLFQRLLNEVTFTSVSSNATKSEESVIELIVRPFPDRPK